MARPLKLGLDYFPHDTDAVNDEKVEALRALYGNDGYAFYFILLERIYRTPNAELDVSDAETIQIFARKVGVTVNAFNEMLETAFKRGCFDRQKYERNGVLTSNGIKKRAGVVTEKRQQMRQKYERSIVSGVVSSPISSAETIPETRQRKAKKSKVKKSNNTHPLFDQFWQAYPKKVSKPDAMKAFAKINSDEQLLALIVTKIEQAKTSEQWRDQAGRYIPYPATWLNQRRWEDEYHGEAQRSTAPGRFSSSIGAPSPRT